MKWSASYPGVGSGAKLQRKDQLGLLYPPSKARTSKPSAQRTGVDIQRAPNTDQALPLDIPHLALQSMCDFF